MSVPTDKTVDLFEDIEANVAINCDFTLFDKSTVHVYYGIARDEAIQNADYTVALQAPDYTSFIVTPKTALLNKINALIVLNADETNYIEVRRIVELTTATTSQSARDSAFVSREFDRTALRFQQLSEGLARAFKLPLTATGYDLELPFGVAGRGLMWADDGKSLINSPQRLDTDPTAIAVTAAAAASASATAAAASATAVAADKATVHTDRLAVEAISGSGRGVPLGGTIGQVLAKASATDGDTAWVSIDASATAGATWGYVDGGAPVDADYAVGNQASDQAGRKWTWANLRTWLALQLAPPGEVGLFLRATAPAGWAEGGGTIGDAASSSTTRANADTAALFALAWACDILDTPIYTSAGAASVRGADAATDFAAHKRIQLPDLRGEWLRGWDNGRGINAGRRLGQQQAEMIGPHGHPLTMNAVADHQHTLTADGQSKRGANGNNYGTRWYGSSGDSGDGGTASKATSVGGGHTPTGVAGNNTGTENRVRGVALLGCYKL